MTTDRRNPYVILGLDFGASEAAARSGFGRATRRLRQESDAQYTQEDLTWALHQIEQILIDPDLAFHVYRIPADAGALFSGAPGVFNPAPHRLGRGTPPTTAAELGRLRRQAVAERLASEIAGSTSQRVPRSPYSLRKD